MVNMMAIMQQQQIQQQMMFQQQQQQLQQQVLFQQQQQATADLQYDQQQLISLTSGNFQRFDGTDLDLFPNWMDDVQARVESARVHDGIALKHLTYCLSGNALKRFLTSNNSSSYAKAINYLSTIYTDEYKDTRRCYEFFNRIQDEKESVREYVLVLQSMCRIPHQTPAMEQWCWRDYATV